MNEEVMKDWKRIASQRKVYIQSVEGMLTAEYTPLRKFLFDNFHVSSLLSEHIQSHLECCISYDAFCLLTL